MVIHTFTYHALYSLYGMQRSVLADVATEGHSIDVVDMFDEWSMMVEQTQDTLERLTE